MYQRILIPTDATPLSRKAVTHALALAAEQGAEVVVLNVMPRYPTSYLEGAMVFEAEDVARVEKQWAEQARTLVNRVAEQAQARGIKARAVVVKSDLEKPNTSLKWTPTTCQLGDVGTKTDIWVVSDWTAAVDRSSGRTYYVNLKTRATRWAPPGEKEADDFVKEHLGGDGDGAGGAPAAGGGSQ